MLSTFRTLRAPLAALGLILMSPAPALAGGGNRVQVVQDGENLAAVVVQNGNDNLAAMRQTGRNQTGTIVQNGDSNSACLVQQGRARSTATIVQNGGESVAVLQGIHRTREISLERCMWYVNGSSNFGQLRRR